MNKIFFPALLCCALLLPSCLPRSPETHYYILNPQPEVTERQARQESKIPVQLRRITLPEYLDRSGIVNRRDDGVSLDVTEVHVWGEPLKDGVRRSLTETLAPRLASTAFALENPDEQNARMVISVDILRFEGVMPGKALLDARFSIEHEGKGLLVRENRVFTEPAGESVVALVQAQSRLLRRLGDAIADALMTLQAGK